MTYLIVAIVGAGIVASAAWLVRAAWLCAVEGYQNATGWHAGEPVSAVEFCSLHDRGH